VVNKIGIIGTGIAGVGCAWHLRDSADITLLEQDTRPGGHTNTITVDEDGRAVPIDTGFIVFNKVTYPLLTRLFEELEVTIKPAEMSFSVRHVPDDLEYNGMGLNKVFAQRRNLFRPRFHRFLAQIRLFFQVAHESMEDSEAVGMTVRSFCRHFGLGDDFLEYYLLPMASAVWSSEPGKVLDFPARPLIRFFHNHGFLGVSTHHPWFTVEGGSRNYLHKMLERLKAPVLQCRVVAVTESSGGVQVRTADGGEMHFDRVVIAAHADQALGMLADPTVRQRELLSPFHYQRNHITLHTDASVMPQLRRAWASWNYRIEQREGQRTSTTHYWMNALQGVSPNRNYFVSLNSQGRIPQEKILHEVWYDHPVYSLETMHAQVELPFLNSQGHGQRLYFCGSYFRHGFHEDAYSSGVALSKVIKDHLEQSSVP